MKHKYLLIELDKEYSVDQTHSLAKAIMVFEKVVGVRAIKDPSSQTKSQIVKQILGLECMKEEKDVGKIRLYSDGSISNYDEIKTGRNELRLEIIEAIKKL